jgi:outer membrane immunogenic protein
MRHPLHNAKTTIVLSLCISSQCFSGGMAATPKPQPPGLSDDMKRVLADNYPRDSIFAAHDKELHPPRKPLNIHKTTILRKPLHKHYLRKGLRKHLIKVWRAKARAKQATRVLAIAPPQAASFSYSFDGPYAGFLSGSHRIRRSKPSVYGSLVPFDRYGRASNSPAVGLWGFAGYNKQIGSVIAGLETDIGYAARISTQDPSPYGTLPATSTGVSGSFRGRIGLALFDRVMVYATGGLIVSNLTRYDQSGAYNSVEAGWTAGAGIEGYLSPTLSLRAEYLWSQFPGRRVDTQTIRGGVGFKF